MANSALAILLSASDTASPALKKARGELGGWSAAVAVASAAATALTGLMADLSREGAADAASMEAVRVATENAGTSWEDASGPVDEYLTLMRDLAAVDDSELKPALASLIAVTGDVEKSMQLASLAADISKGKNISLAAASELVGKVAQGNTSILSRYGITLDKNADATEALGELQKRFGGQAEAYGNTTKGQMDRINLTIGDFREQIGSALNEMAPWVGLLPGLSAAYTALGGAVGLLTKTYGANVISNVAHKVATLAGTAATVALTAAQWLLNAALTANPIGIVIVALAALAGGLMLAWQNSEEFRAIVTAAFDLVARVIGDSLSAAGETIGNFGRSVEGAWTAASDATRTMVQNVQRALANLANVLPNLANAGNQLIASLWDGITGAWSSFSSRVQELLAGVKNLLPNLVQAGKNMIQNLWDGVVSRWNDFWDWLREKMRDLQSLLGSTNPSSMSLTANLTGPGTVRGSGFAAGAAAGSQIVVTGNTFLSEDTTTLRNLARLLKPYLDTQVRLA